ncbi:hypothetical protein DIPPA_16568 [Diplonema papillatum]|nr:hypothetical protein DIPPA_16568 [Diplonema papillatum]
MDLLYNTYNSSVKAFGRESKEERTRREEEKRLDNLEQEGACCICESTFGTNNRVEFADVAALHAAYQREIRGYICELCMEVATAAPATSTDAKALKPGGWRCKDCNASNAAVAKVCDKCSARRPPESQGRDFTISIKPNEELGLNCLITGGAVQIDEIVPGSAAERAGIVEGVLTTVEGQQVFSSIELRKVVGKARAEGKTEIKLKIIPRQSKRNALQKTLSNDSATSARSATSASVSKAKNADAFDITPAARGKFPTSLQSSTNSNTNGLFSASASQMSLFGAAPTSPSPQQHTLSPMQRSENSGSLFAPAAPQQQQQQTLSPMQRSDNSGSLFASAAASQQQQQQGLFMVAPPPASQQQQPKAGGGGGGSLFSLSSSSSNTNNHTNNNNNNGAVASGSGNLFGAASAGAGDVFGALAALPQKQTASAASLDDLFSAPSATQQQPNDVFPTHSNQSAFSSGHGSSWGPPPIQSAAQAAQPDAWPNAPAFQQGPGAPFSASGSSNPWQPQPQQQQQQPQQQAAANPFDAGPVPQAQANPNDVFAGLF